MAYSCTILEEELKNRVRNDYFQDFENALIIGKIDFCISQKLFDIDHSFLWAEAKKGNKSNIYESIIQLILTIGKARTFDTYSPPVFLGAFDAEKIAFLEYHYIMGIFSKNDFNWNVTPSDHGTKEFQELYNLLMHNLQKHIIIYDFEKESKELQQFVNDNFKIGHHYVNKIAITKNNFVAIYYKWREKVKPSINMNWEDAKKHLILDADFYLADILSVDNVSIKEKLSVVLREDKYEYLKTLNILGHPSVSNVHFKDEQIAHTQFWNRYTRPPKEEFWDYIIERRDLLVEQDIRERKGAFYTPLKWVMLSQQYMADYFGDDYQDEYYIWDCAAGTGNLLNGLTNKYKIFASTIDQADVDVLKERSSKTKTLLEDNIFQFDFLNDSFDKCPKELQEIIRDEERRKKLIIYINPPYAEATTKTTFVGTGKNKAGVAHSEIFTRYQDELGAAKGELFAQFLIRIFMEIRGCKLAQFSKLKAIQSSNFSKFREVFNAKLEKLFIVPADTFDNVSGQFPIGFFIWDTEKNQKIEKKYIADVYAENSTLEGKKSIFIHDKKDLIVSWLRKFYDKQNLHIGYLLTCGTDIQHNNYIFMSSMISENTIKKKMFANVTHDNLLEMSIYYTIRHVVRATWKNDRDQYLTPKHTYTYDEKFKTDCLTFALFDNNVQSEDGVNHWIPFTEQEVEPRRSFESHFMTDYMKGKLKPKASSKSIQGSLIAENSESRAPKEPLVFSDEARAVFDAGRELWRYYHKKDGSNPNASLYDIKKRFQDVNSKGKMNNKSEDGDYNDLIGNLRDKLKILAAKIEPKVYEHGFLLK